MSTYYEYRKQFNPDWIDISQVNDNEINLLVSDGGVGVAFQVNVAGSGTYSIDWGDGVVEDNRTSGSVQSHIYTFGSGKSVDGGAYSVFKIRIYNATDTITRFQVRRHPDYNRTPQISPILQAVFGTQGMTDYSYTFYNPAEHVKCSQLQACTIQSFANCKSTSYMLANCSGLKSVILPTSWGNVTNVSYMLSGCSSLLSVTLPASWDKVTNTSYMLQGCSRLQTVNLPTSWGKVTDASDMLSGCSGLISLALPSSWGHVTNVSYMLFNCSSLITLTLPSSWGSVTNVNHMLYGCSGLITLTLPTSWGSVTNASDMLNGCSSLISLTLPTSWGNVTNASYMLSGCHSLKTINNTEYLGSTTTDVNFMDFMRNAQAFDGTLTIASRLSKISVHSDDPSMPNKLTGLRLTNPNSTFTGDSPHVDVSYCSMDAEALNTLFEDLPTLTGKTIKIIGNPGSGTCNTSIATSKGWTVIDFLLEGEQE